MGISVLLVDDEKLERVLIRQGFDWEKNGFEIIGEADCAEDALEFVRYRKPEVVITDISMPRMDGLKLAEEIRKLNDSCRIVIVTGYREFEYARRAARIGVEDFLLKPVNIQDMETVAEKIKEQKEQENRQRTEVEELKRSILADQSIVLESFLQRLVSGRVTEEETYKKLAMYNYEKLLDGFICVNLHIHGEKSGKIDDVLTDCCNKNVLCFTHYMQNRLLFFMMDRNDTETLQEAHRTAAKVHERILEQEMSVVTGISSWHRGIEGIAEAYKESENAVSASVYLGKDRMITYDEYEKSMQQQSVSEEINWDKLLLCLENCMEEKVQHYVADYMQKVWCFKVKSAAVLRLMTMNFLTKAAAGLNRYGMSLIQLTDEEELYNEIGEINSVEEMQSVLLRQLDTIMEYYRSKRQRKGNHVVEGAIMFIHENLYDPQLSLKTISAGIFSNESYLSRVFKKEMGISLIEYITQKRIEESIRLLDTTDYKAYEIAEKIGFRDPHYFSICFKRYTGKTIKEYKETEK
ncbi:MAG: response regulator [Agathobacter sp.]